MPCIVDFKFPSLYCLLRLSLGITIHPQLLLTYLGHVWYASLCPKKLPLKFFLEVVHGSACIPVNSFIYNCLISFRGAHWPIKYLVKQLLVAAGCCSDFSFCSILLKMDTSILVTVSGFILIFFSLCCCHFVSLLNLCFIFWLSLVTTYF